MQSGLLGRVAQTRTYSAVRRLHHEPNRHNARSYVTRFNLASEIKYKNADYFIIIIIIIIEQVWFKWRKLKAAIPHTKVHSVAYIAQSHAVGVTSGKLRAKSSVLSSRLKSSREVDKITSGCRAFLTLAATAGKARSPTVESRDVGTAKVSDDCRSLTLCMHSADKYAGVALS